MYPRPGKALVPKALRNALDGLPVSPALVDQLGLAHGTRLVELDRTVWRDHNWMAVEELAGEIANAIDHATLEQVGDTELFEDRPNVDSLKLEPRVENALRRSGMVQHGRLVPTLVRQLMDVSNFGVKALLDVLTAVEACDGEPKVDTDVLHPQPVGSSPAVKKVARSLRRKRWSRLASPEDPRISSILGPTTSGAATIQELADWIANEEYTPGEARSMVARVRRAVREVDALSRLTLSEELIDVLEAVSGRRTDAALVARLGLDGSEPTTLEVASSRVGVTRERVRQLEKQFRQRVEDAGRLWMPVLDKAIELVDTMLPVAPRGLEEALASEGLAKGHFSIESLVSACDVFGREVPFEVAPEGLLVRRGHAALPAVARSAALRLVEHWGASTIADVEARLEEDGQDADPETIRLAVETMDAFSWLDDAHRWFWVAGVRNRVLNQVEKIMSVAGSIDLSDLRRGVGRHHRMSGFRPPREVLAALCVKSGAYRREGDVIAGGVDLADWRELLGRNEQVLAETLFDHGSIMRRDDLVRIVVDDRGLKTNSVSIYLGYSPIIERYAPGVYGLRGARVSAAQVEALIAPRVRHQVLQDHGWTSDGRLWIAFRLSPASASTGVLGTPAAVRAVAEGSYPLFNEEGSSVGALVVEDNMWGLSPFFNRWGVEAGDYVVLSLDTRERSATILAGTEELLLRFQSGE